MVDCVVRNACDMGAPMEDSHKGGRLRGKLRDPLNESYSIVINRRHALINRHGELQPLFLPTSSASAPVAQLKRICTRVFII